MNEHKAVPNIRFRNFKDEWTKKKISNFIIKNSDKNKNLVIKNIESISNKTGFTKQSEQFDGYRVASQDISNYYVISPNQFAYNPSRINVGSIAYKKKGEDKSIISPLYISFSTSSHINDSFLWFWFKTTSFKKQRIQFSEGGVRDTLPFENLKKMEISSPLLQEQKKIGNFFAKLDKLLDLQQQKIDKLELLKKALLQKLFPKHDAKIPELRFKGFEDVWRKHRLKEVSKIIGGGTPDTKNPKYWNGNINWFSPNEIGNSPYAVSSHKKITDLGLKKSSAKLHPAEKTILFTSRAGIGDMAILTKPAATNQGFQSLELNNNVDSYFVYSYGFEIKKKANRLASGSTFLEISKNEMEKITLMFPSEQEQQKIGNFLSKVDKLIELENQKLQNFQQVKKCLLQNMFVE